MLRDKFLVFFSSKFKKIILNKKGQVVIFSDKIFHENNHSAVTIVKPKHDIIKQSVKISALKQKYSNETKCYCNENEK